MSAAINFPFSELSETVRSVVFDAASHKRAAGAAQIVAVTSALPGEGKTMLAANLAAYFAKQGKRVHLVDFNLKNPALSRLFASRRSHQELVDHTATGATGKDAPGATKAADFEFSGQTTQTRSSDFIELVNPEAIANYLDSLKADYDIVVLDVGALSESSDARMCAELADYVVLAVKWNLISAEQLERVLARGLTRQGKTVAAVLTMVPRSERLERSATAEPSARRLQVA